MAIDANATAQTRQSRLVDVFDDGYRTVDELYADMAVYEETYPNLTEIVAYGQSECLAAGGCINPGGNELPGYELRALRITNEAVSSASTINGTTITRGQKPVLFLMANIHAREITTPELAMRLQTGSPGMVLMLMPHGSWINMRYGLCPRPILTATGLLSWVTHRNTATVRSSSVRMLIRTPITTEFLSATSGPPTALLNMASI
ncbi:MAG: hypothetical protein R3C44_06420 [Chloroflexota bacterium]